MAKDKFLEKQGRARHTALLLDDSFLWRRLLAAAQPRYKKKRKVGGIQKSDEEAAGSEKP